MCIIIADTCIIFKVNEIVKLRDIWFLKRFELSFFKCE